MNWTQTRRERAVPDEHDGQTRANCPYCVHARAAELGLKDATLKTLWTLRGVRENGRAVYPCRVVLQ